MINTCWYGQATCGKRAKGKVFEMVDKKQSLRKQVIQALLTHQEGSTRLAYNQHCLVGYHTKKEVYKKWFPASSNVNKVFSLVTELRMGREMTILFLILWLSANQRKTKTKI